jgi:hypothetical protein
VKPGVDKVWRALSLELLRHWRRLLRNPLFFLIALGSRELWTTFGPESTSSAMGDKIRPHNAQMAPFSFALALHFHLGDKSQKKVLVLYDLMPMLSVFQLAVFF